MMAKNSFMAKRRRLGLGAIAPDYIVSLLTIIPEKRPCWGVEVGVFRGDCSARLLLNRPQLAMILVDSYQSDPTATAGDKRAFSQYSQDVLDDMYFSARHRLEMFGPRANWMRYRSDYAAKLLDDLAFDFVFLDADHRYESVRSDIEAWWPKVRVGGVLCGHDWGGPMDAVRLWGVDRAVNDFLARNPPYRTWGVKPGRLWFVEKK